MGTGRTSSSSKSISLVYLFASICGDMTFPSQSEAMAKGVAFFVSRPRAVSATCSFYSCEG